MRNGLRAAWTVTRWALIALGALSVWYEILERLSPSVWTWEATRVQDGTTWSFRAEHEGLERRMVLSDGTREDVYVWREEREPMERARR